MGAKSLLTIGLIIFGRIHTSAKDVENYSIMMINLS